MSTLQPGCVGEVTLSGVEETIYVHPMGCVIQPGSDSISQPVKLPLPLMEVGQAHCAQPSKNSMISFHY